jgi:hypothetical protein
MLKVLSAQRINAIQDLLKELCQENGRLKKKLGSQASMPMRNDEVRVYSFMPGGASEALGKMPPDCNNEQKGLALQRGLSIPWSEVLQVPMVDSTIVGTTCVRLKDDACNEVKSGRDRFKGHGDQWEFVRPGIYEIEIRTSTQYRRKTTDCRNLPDFTIAKWLSFGGTCNPSQGGGFPDSNEWNSAGDGLATNGDPTGWSHNQRVNKGNTVAAVPIGGRCFEEFSWKLRGLSCEVEGALKQIKQLQDVLCMDEDKLPDGTVVDDSNAQVGGPITQNPPKSHILTFFNQKFEKLCKDFGVIIDQIASADELKWENESDREAIASLFKDIAIPVADKQTGPDELELCPELDDYKCPDNGSLPCPECPEE